MDIYIQVGVIFILLIIFAVGTYTVSSGKLITVLIIAVTIMVLGIIGYLGYKAFSKYKSIKVEKGKDRRFDFLLAMRSDNQYLNVLQTEIANALIRGDKITLDMLETEFLNEISTIDYISKSSSMIIDGSDVTALNEVIELIEEKQKIRLNEINKELSLHREYVQKERETVVGTSLMGPSSIMDMYGTRNSSVYNSCEESTTCKESNKHYNESHYSYGSDSSSNSTSDSSSNSYFD